MIDMAANLDWPTIVGTMLGTGFAAFLATRGQINMLIKKLPDHERRLDAVELKVEQHTTKIAKLEQRHVL